MAPHRRLRRPSDGQRVAVARRQVVVAIHDVCPPFVSEIRFLLSQLDAIGARPRVLKVIPGAPGAALRDCPALVHLLQDEVAGGSEIVLHGWTHQAAGRIRGPWLSRLRARLFAGPAAELLTLETDDLRWRLDAGRQALRELGFAVNGFCAPAWLAPPGLPRLLRELGFRHQVGLASLHDLVTDRRLTMAWLGYMGAGPGQEHLIGAVGRAFLAASFAAPVIKVFLHPQGAPASGACSRTLAILAGLVEHRTVTTYEQLLHQRSCR